MKKKIVSFLKNSHIQYFALGTVLAVVISFSLSAVFAQTNPTVYKFIQPDNGLVNRIGSLSVNRGDTASWINPKGWHSGNRDGKRETCLTTYGLSDKNEVESCLDVNGIGAFSKIITLDIPTFIYPTLFLNSSADFNTTVGLPSGLIIEDDPNTTNDSILAAGLQYTDANGALSPRDLTSKRNLCADKTTGELYPCGGTIDTYHWETGAWGVCSAATEASCDGGQWNTGDCTIHFEYDGVAPGTQAWGYINQASRDAINNGINDVHVSASSLSDCRNQAIHMCDGFPASDNPVTENYGCSAFDQQNYEVHYGTNPSYQATIHNCSDINPGDKNTCEAQNDGHTCTWTPAGQSTQTRTVNCVDSNGNTVQDSVCVNAGVSVLPSEDLDGDNIPDRVRDCVNDPAITITYANTTNTSCPAHERTMYIQGGANQELHYSYESDIGHAANVEIISNGLSFNPTLNPRGNVTGTVTLDNSGSGSLSIGACGGSELNGSSGDVYGIFTLKNLSGDILGSVGSSALGARR